MTLNQHRSTSACASAQYDQQADQGLHCLPILCLRGMNTLSGEVTLSKCFCLPFVKGSTLKRKNLLPKGEQILSFESRPLFRRGLKCEKANRKSQKL